MRRIITFIAAASLATLGLGVLPAQASAGSCTYQAVPPFPANLWVRSGPGEGYAKVGAIGYREYADGPCQSQGDWTQVWADGGAGWAYSPYLREY
ncbi:hypothetical protein OIE66_21380 [Nonomuraea sp. NBC_01738]|uniref:SH3 domain-containing protein n=1 Tax=Nonomuraea sp. NBC_01738 TaxID=2976003 RepID=UPI002E150F67|nr:hypothetical protein OIE66_21380 [Nonomuraea sp. NBC_01738]